jgi:hypothetical protein
MVLSMSYLEFLRLGPNQNGNIQSLLIMHILVQLSS